MEIISKYPIESYPHFLTLNYESDRIFVSNNGSHSVSIINSISNIVEHIELDFPQNLVYSPNFNRLYIMSGDSGFRNPGTSRQIAVIDLNTYEIIKKIGEKEAFGGITIDSKNNKIYATRHKEKKVLKIDEKTLEVEKEINVKDKYKHVIFNENTNELILAGAFGMFGKHTISCFNETNNKFEKIFKTTQVSYDDIFEMKFYPKMNFLLIFLDNKADPIGPTSLGSRRIYLLNYDNPNSKSYFHESVIQNTDFVLDESKKCVYYISANWKGTYQIMKRTSPNYDVEKFDLSKDIGYPQRITVSQKTGNLLLTADSKNGLFLYEISL